MNLLTTILLPQIAFASGNLEFYFLTHDFMSNTVLKTSHKSCIPPSSNDFPNLHLGLSGIATLDLGNLGLYSGMSTKSKIARNGDETGVGRWFHRTMLKRITR